MSKIILYIAQSLDGFIAAKDGSVAWLDAFNTENYGYTEFLKSVDMVVMGSNTYAQVLTFGDYPYPDKISYIYTKRSLPKKDKLNINFISDFSVDFYNKIAENKTIWLVGGSKLIQTFMHYNLISEFQIFTMPIILGSGIPLFNQTKNVKLDLINTKTFINSVVFSKYKLPILT